LLNALGTSHLCHQRTHAMLFRHQVSRFEIPSVLRDRQRMRVIR
jgi:hypothetical protein